MFRPQIQKTRVLIFMALFSLLMVYSSRSSKVVHTAVGYKEKLEASEIMESALKILKKEVRKKLNINGDYKILKAIDPNKTGLIFKDDSPIRSSSGDLLSKQTVLKPNFAALVVNELMNAGIKDGDTVAIGMTGSMPGANIATLSACKSMNVFPVVISSVGASTWGATDPEFTWLDMEYSLVKNKILDNQSIYASLGGRGDCLRKSDLNEWNEGRKLIKLAAERNNISLIPYVLPLHEQNLSKSIDKRIKLYADNIGQLDNYAAYINVGGGAASIGIGGKDILLKPGYLSVEDILYSNPNNSVIRKFAQAGVPAIHILHIPQMVKGVIPFGSEKSDTGLGILYKEERYNLLIAGIALILSLGLVIGIGVYSHEQIKKRMQSYEPESIL